MLWFLFCQDDLLLTEHEGKGWGIPDGDAPPVALERWHTVHRLPDLEGVPCRCVALDSPVVGEGVRMVGLRASYDLLPRSLYDMAGKGREILYWDRNTKFCGVCGGPMKLHTDISKRCTNCGKEVWPSLAIAIIVRITRGNEMLLVQSRNFRGDYMGLVAGFVETGETLEECVQREVWEETHLRVENIRYFGSQPWPYPSGLMVGFTADYAGGDLRLQRSELRKGGWFDKDRLPEIPGKVSMARMLIDDFLERQENE